MSDLHTSPTLELVPVESPTDAAVSATTEPTKVQPVQAPASTEASDAAQGMLLLMALGLVGLLLFSAVMSGFQWLFDVNLRERIFRQPLWAVSYVFLVAISIFCGFEIRSLIKQQRSKELRRSFALMVLLAGMLAYLMFYAHHTWALSVPENSIFAGVAALFGLAIGWVLPSMVGAEPYGSLTYLILLILLVAFTWLARLESNVVYGWASFSLIFTYFLRLAVDGVRRSASRTKRGDA
jgi:hypothetical protein